MNWLPNRKVTAGASVGMPLAVVLAWGASLGGVEMPIEVSTALGGIITALVSYFVPEPTKSVE